MLIIASRCVLAAVLALSVHSASVPQSAKSASSAKQLTDALDAGKLDAIAAADPSDPGVFVAALYIQGSQLLVVSAKYAAPPLLTAKIKAKDYRDVYIDLSSASVAGSKVFIIDQNCDGLSSKPDGGAPGDSWEAGTLALTFDGDWRKAKMTEDAYGKAFADADDRYARLLALLTAQVKQ